MYDKTGGLGKMRTSTKPTMPVPYPKTTAKPMTTKPTAPSKRAITPTTSQPKPTMQKPNPMPTVPRATQPKIAVGVGVARPKTMQNTMGKPVAQKMPNTMGKAVAVKSVNIVGKPKSTMTAQTTVAKPSVGTLRKVQSAPIPGPKKNW